MLSREARPARRARRDDALGARLVARDSAQEELARVVERAGVADPRVLEAFRRVPRAAFVPAEVVGRAYRDEPLPIPHRQVTTQPSLIAKMVEALGLAGDERVLEVGAGHGFQTALLAELAAAVWSVERWPDLAETARSNLERHGAPGAELVVGDGTLGLPEHAPYDAVVVAAAYPSVPEPLAAQLAPEGRLVHPVGPGGREDVALFENGPDGLVRRRTITGAHFVRLVGEHGFDAGLR